MPAWMMISAPRYREAAAAPAVMDETRRRSGRKRPSSPDGRKGRADRREPLGPGRAPYRSRQVLGGAWAGLAAAQPEMGLGRAGRASTSSRTSMRRHRSSSMKLSMCLRDGHVPASHGAVSSDRKGHTIQMRVRLTDEAS